MAQIVAFIMKHTNTIIWLLVAILVVSQAFVIKDKNSQLRDLQSQYDTTRMQLRQCNGSLATLKTSSADERKKSMVVNSMLTKCYNDMEVIRQGRSEIDTIMNATDNTEQSTSKKEEIKNESITDTTNKLGISFINKQFSSVE